ncbi:cobalt-precorrin-6A reductase [Luteipulveratus mongoliensis]|uniref:Cobalt-precorrin-6X reductase n=1 Tax=Luteipulveratus mongoliensis TaxID=571913 RepID=A0A0K1JM56_9MICO|nr:cobalt-precorrin-6A reductase [Luteipulveratus mongoliensis]AKU17791.1 cobalt-precorrin-6X reductase [Luteipulveratus mongoliensis]
MKVLLLGGTSEARSLASLLSDAAVPLISSLAGAVKRPRLPAGETRIGGFGGIDGLASYLAHEGISHVVDATHPFAATISSNAVQACARAEVPLLRLERPGWSEHPEVDSWHWADHHVAAAETAARLGGPVLLTTGRQHLADFVPALHEHPVIARVVDEPEMPLPDRWSVLRSRGPYTVDGERTLLQDRGIRTLVTKDSGGRHTEPKLTAAAALGVAVVVVRRPATSSAQMVTTAEEACAWVLSATAPPAPSHPR